MIAEVDEDGNGDVDFTEFLTMMARKMSISEAEDDIVEAFKVFDGEESGRITAQRLTHVFHLLNVNVTDEEVEELVREGDHDRDGYINYEEFVRMMMELGVVPDN